MRLQNYNLRSSNPSILCYLFHSVNIFTENAIDYWLNLPEKNFYWVLMMIVSDNKGDRQHAKAKGKRQ